MLVEDEPDILHTTALLLEHHGYAVIMASSPASALQLLDADLPDIIVTDYMMPGMDGRAFVRALRERPGARRIPVVMMSAVAPRGDGAWDKFLRKPVDIADLVQALRTLLGGRAGG